jgi:hypothetical protein
VTAYRLVADPRVDLDVAATHQWYEDERAGLGLESIGGLQRTLEAATLALGRLDGVSAFPSRRPHQRAVGDA